MLYSIVLLDLAQMKQNFRLIERFHLFCQKSRESYSIFLFLLFEELSLTIHELDDVAILSLLESNA